MLHLVGAGPGNIEYLTKIARDKIIESKKIIAFGRIGTSIEELNGNLIKVNRVLDLIDKIKEVEHKNEDITVVASGDPCFYGILEYLKKQGFSDINVIPGISSMQYLASKLNLSHHDIKHLSLHGRDLNQDFFKSIYDNKVVSFLTDKVNTPHKVAEKLKEAGYRGEFIVGYNLSYEDELISKTTILEVKEVENPLACVIFIREENKEANEEKIGINTFKDEDFLREKVPMTKYEIRLLSIEALELFKGCKLLEIGSGTGSVTIEALRRDAKVTSIECNKEAYDLTLENKNKLMPHKNLDLIFGKAPLNLEDEVYDRVFIGGSRGELGPIFNYLDDHFKEGGLIVGNFVTLKNLFEFKNELINHNYKDIEITLVQVSKEDKIGILRGENPIFIVKAKKK